MRQAIVGASLLLLASAVLDTSGASAMVRSATEKSRAAGPQFTGWSAPVNLGPAINSAVTETGPALSKNGLTLYFYATGRPGGVGNDDIWVSQRESVDDAWGTPVNLGSTVNSTARDFVPTFSRDGHWMFFASTRDGGLGGADVWASWRARIHDDFGWETPINLGPGVNTAFDDNGVGYFENEGGAPQLYFGSNRPGGLGDADLHVSELQPDGSWGPASRVPELNSSAADNRPNIRHDGLEIFFYSGRAGGLGGIDLWTSTRESVDQPWSTPVNVGAPVNSSGTELHPYLAADGETLFFSSAAPGGSGGLDLYMSSRSKERGHSDHT
jgi:hypothetical protein